MSGIIGISPNMNSGIVGEYPPGHVIQTKTGEYDTQTTHNADTDSWNTVGLTVTIDPIYVNSTILVFWVCNVFVQDDDGNFGCGFRIDRTGPSSSTVYSTGGIGTYDYAASYLSGVHQLVDTFAGNAMDSPASTATCTYIAKINDNACGDAASQYGGVPTTITLQEIKV